MNNSLQKEVENAALLYATNRNEFYNQYKNTVHEIYLKNNFSDVNYSSLAENIPMLMTNWIPHVLKHQYDGYRGADYKSASEFIECKPEKTNNLMKSKISGHATWNDISFKKIEKLKNDKLTLMFTGWIEGYLMYIVTVPHNYDILINKLSEQLNSAIINNKARRNGSVNYNSWIDCPELKIEWLAKEEIWNLYPKKYNKKFYNRLKQIYNKINE